MPDPLPFEYPSRASQFVGTPDQIQAALVDERDRALEDYLQRFRVGEWLALTLQGTFTNTATAGAQAAQVRKVGDIVQVRFHVAPGVSGTAVFTLDVGFRPPGFVDVPCIAFNGVHNIANAFVQTSGVVILSWTAAAVTSISSVFQFSVTP